MWTMVGVWCGGVPVVVCIVCGVWDVSVVVCMVCGVWCVVCGVLQWLCV